MQNHPTAEQSAAFFKKGKPCREALLWITGQLNGADLCQFLKSRESLAEQVMRGFKLSPANADKNIVRKRLLAQLAKDTDHLLALLKYPQAPWQPWLQATPMMAQAWLRENWAILLRATQDLNLVVAFAADDRKPISALGQRLCRRPSLWQETLPFRSSPPPTEWTFLQSIVTADRDKEEEAEKAHDKLQKAYDKATKRQHALGSEIEKLKQALDKQKARTATETAERKQAERNRTQDDRVLRQKLKTAKEKLQNLQANFEEELHRRLQCYRREALGVTDHVLKIEQELRKPESRELTERAKATLEAHKQLNEKYSTLSELRRQIHSLEKADADLERCARESVQVLPELHALQQDIKDKLDALRALLPDDNVPADVHRRVGNILKLIRNCTNSNRGLEKLTKLESFLETELFGEIVGAENIELINNALKQQKERLQQIDRERTLAKMQIPEPEVKTGVVPFPRDIPDIENALAQLDQSRKPVMYIDGYNVILGSPALAEILDAEGLATARYRLSTLCQRVASQFTEINLVYDGTDALSERVQHGNLTEIFAARIEHSQNADNYITAQMHNRENADQLFWLVTADYGLRIRNRTACHGLIDPADLIAFLRD
ncbi:MAG: NYN domain-containing protein [Lentisphaeria bacterium]